MPRVAASVSTEDVRRAYYDQANNAMQWWWVREINLDPTELIVDDEEGHLFRVPFSVSGTEITFGEPSEVRIEYVAAADGTSEAARRHSVTVFASRTESRPEGGADVPDLSTLRTSLGLPDETSDDDVLARAAEVAAEAETARQRIAELEAKPEGEPPKPVAPALPDGVVTIDSSTLEDLRVAASRGQEAHETLRIQRRDGYIESAVRAGKFAPARRDHFAKLYDVDEEGTRSVIDGLAANTIPVEAKGYEGDVELTSDDAIWHAIYGADITKGA